MPHRRDHKTSDNPAHENQRGKQKRHDHLTARPSLTNAIARSFLNAAGDVSLAHDQFRRHARFANLKFNGF